LFRLSLWIDLPNFTFIALPIIIIIIAHRQQWSVAMALHDVHVPLCSATSVSSWPVFRRRSAVSTSFETSRRSTSVRARTVTGFRCNDLFHCLMCRCGSVQSDDVTEQCMTFLANYIGNVRQAGHGGYVDVLHMVLPFDTQYLALASHVEWLQPAHIVCQQGPCISTVQQHPKNAGLIESQLGAQTQSLLSPAGLHRMLQRRPLQCVGEGLGSMHWKTTEWIPGTEILWLLQRCLHQPLYLPQDHRKLIHVRAYTFWYLRFNIIAYTRLNQKMCTGGVYQCKSSIWS